MSELGIGSEVSGYRIGGVIGRGGMGVVYRGTDERLGRSAAVKVIAPERSADATFRRRFLEESRAAAAIDHPNVLPVYAAGEQDGMLFLVTRLVDGPDLARLLEEEGALGPDRALAICAQVGAGLDAAHAKGLTHRDVKPANVLVTREAGTGAELCYLTDFGLAQRVDRQTRLTKSGQLVGTLDYIAPEQIQGGAVDGRADLYALGAMFHECATGEPPFLRDSQPALLYAHLSEPPPRISEKLAAAPAALDGVVARALAKSPEDRYASCAEFVAAARAALAGADPRRVTPTTNRVISETVVSADEGVEGDRAPTHDVDGKGPGRRRILIAGLILAAIAATTVALVLALGRGDGSEQGDTTAELRLATEEISVARTLGDDTSRLSESVSSGKPTSAFVADFERSGARAGSLVDQIGGELDEGDPSAGALRAAARDLRTTAARQAAVAAAPGVPAATRQAREAKRSMEGAVAGIESALGALRIGFIDEGNVEIGEAVEESVTRLQSVRLSEPFDALLAAL